MTNLRGQFALASSLLQILGDLSPVPLVIYTHANKVKITGYLTYSSYQNY